jgi:transcriptional regulator with XRE-family HTH domain
MAKRYSNVSKMVKGISSDKKFAEETVEYLSHRTLARFLSTLRCSAGLTQKDMAEKMACSQSKVSKLESSPDEKIAVKDLVQFARALDKRLAIGFENQDITIVEQIKRHVFSIKHLLDQLAVLAKDDDAIDRGVSHFFMETAVNFFRCLHESAVDLRRINVRKVADESRPALKVENLDVPDEEEQLIEQHHEPT